MEFKIGGERYKLEKISIYISDLYRDYVIARNAGVTVEAEMEEAQLQCEIAEAEAETRIERLRARAKLFAEARRISRESLKKLETTATLQKRILEEIVKLNGYEFFEKKWIETISEDDFNALIDELIGKKKVAERST